MTTTLEGGEWSAARPGRTLPPGKTRCPLYRRLGGPQGRSGRAENSAPPGFDPRTVQPVVSRYTDWATLPLIHICTNCNYQARKLLLSLSYRPVGVKFVSTIQKITEYFHTRTKRFFLIVLKILLSIIEYLKRGYLLSIGVKCPYLSV